MNFTGKLQNSFSGGGFTRINVGENTIRSVVVVLPASTWAKIPIFLYFVKSAMVLLPKVHYGYVIKIVKVQRESGMLWLAENEINVLTQKPKPK
jgi:hypothetical protein